MPLMSSTSWHGVKLKLAPRYPLSNELDFQRHQLDYLTLSKNSKLHIRHVTKVILPPIVFFLSGAINVPSFKFILYVKVEIHFFVKSVHPCSLLNRLQRP